ncbi:hypothetical protein [Synechococcus sp. CCY9201]|uniref:hypothetical protein n=1 Tax=Synechococcus sp. CCY9201 TaxID=174697 RepID=UPI002B1E9BEE|nr:hypothetical protein [Synechococcus sp. CCY9201]
MDLALQAIQASTLAAPTADVDGKLSLSAVLESRIQTSFDRDSELKPTGESL